MSGRAISRLTAVLLVGVCSLVTSAILPACSSGEPSDENGEPAVVHSGLTKGTPGAVNGDADYCANPANKCAAGEGACVDKTQCVTGLGCVNKYGHRYGLASAVDVCTPANCHNGYRDGTETAIDCGGNCGPCYPQCSTGTNGSSTFCAVGCLCGKGQGYCNSSGDCQGGLTCSTLPAQKFGLPAKTKVCVAPHCIDGVQNGGETGLDCGGTDCGNCLGSCSGTLGSVDYCNGCLCSAGQGNCTATVQCASGLVCGANQGNKFGMSTSTNVCVAAHCVNGTLDTGSGETDVDCGGECGTCPLGDVDAGSSHGCAISAGAVKCWGNNSSGQVGNGNTTNQPTPVVVSGLTSGYSYVAAGLSHSCTVGAGNVVKCWGNNATGQLGRGNTTSSLTPVNVTSPPANIVQLRAGGNTTCARTSAGAVWCWGDNSSGQTGNGQVTGMQTTPHQVSGITNAVDIAVGLDHACAALSTGGAVCWGSNGHRQLGDNTATNSGTPRTVALGGALAVQVAAGDSHSCARISDGTVYCWGNNAENSLAIGATNNGRVPAVVPGATSITSIAASGSATCGVSSDHNVWCWGYGQEGEVGAGSTYRVYTAPALVQNTLTRGYTITGGDQFFCTKTINAQVYCWGNDNLGALGKGTVALRTTPTAITSPPAGFTQISAGDVSSCLIAGSKAYCWGDNDSGQLGDGTVVQRRAPVAVSGGFADLTAVAVGSGHACAVRSGGGAVCWGSNFYGQLGDGSTTQTLTPVSVSGLSTATAIGAGVIHSCARLLDGTVSCWGNNVSGELGNGTNTPSSTPVSVSGVAGATALAVGQRHACAVVSGGAVRCWGNDTSGQVGNGATSSTGVLTATAVVGLPSAASGVAAGQLHSCALLTNGTVYCWGDNSVGQLGNGTLINSLTPVPVSGLSSVAAITSWGSHTCARLTNGALRCWGQNTRGQLGNGAVAASATTPVAAGGTTFTMVTAGGRHTCGQYVSNGSVRCWGYNDYGQVGDSTSWLFPQAAAATLP